MKKGLSNKSSSSDSGLGLSKAHILRGRSNFKLLFEKKAIVYSGTFITLRFRIFTGESRDFKIGFVAPKRIGKAVQRNKLKRRMREAYRHHQHILTDMLSESDVSLHGVLMAKKMKFSYAEAEKDMVYLLDKAGACLQATSEA